MIPLFLDSLEQYSSKYFTFAQYPKSKDKSF